MWPKVSSNISVATLAGPDLITTAFDGTILTDTRVERLADARAFRDKCLRHNRDPLLNGLLASFQQAVDDPADCMTHLFEIRVALKARFGSIKQARDALSLSETEWRDLDDITNNRPIDESPHRGRHPDRRPATGDEYNRVFAVARQ